jgi:guanine nucleotide-binding protein subunit alpha
MWTFIDMGGQRPERAKWERAMSEGIRGVFFFVSSEEFDVDSTEEVGKTKFEIALATWRDLLTNPCMEHLSVFVLLNKIDLLEKKIKSDFASFKARYPKYDGEKTPEGVLAFMKGLFLAEVPDTIRTEFVSIVNCCALDTSLMEEIFLEAKGHLLTRSVEASGFGF